MKKSAFVLSGAQRTWQLQSQSDAVTWFGGCWKTCRMEFTTKIGHCELQLPMVTSLWQIGKARWLDAKGQLEVAIGLVAVAADQGRLNVVRWLIDRDADDTVEKHLTDLGGEVSLSIHHAAVNGHSEVAKYLRVRAEKPTNSLQRGLERAGYRRNMEELYQQLGVSMRAAPVTAITLGLAAENGHLEVVQWLYAEYSQEVDEATANNGTPEIHEWILENNP
ncbi:hypothetical protein PHYPSEUDO_006275 [Phytophthora pseudosyringae]|uniref:Uncharacterized protein n=1 Tax=Phytophthora pseudosyringae TaxID=221518 RepID=A0A8T1VJG7_9STRA|nr:hypothetical protein PHYPSEUDO_006275 [Phytophthora pseudosyringae]